MIWCVDDDNAIRDIEVYTLNSTGFKARGFCDGASMLEALKTEKPQLIVLDIMLPGEDGVKILKKLKQMPDAKNIPVIMATAKGSEYDKIQSLDFGADDYLVKPFGVMEMVSRIKAVLRRCNNTKDEKILSVSGVTVNLDNRTVFTDGEKVQLTYKEFELLSLFLSHIGTVFTREQLLSDIWGINYRGETRTVDMHIKTLRQKLGKYGALIKTVISVGYRMEDML